MPPTSPPIRITSRILPSLLPHNTHPILHSTPIELFVDASSPLSITKNRDNEGDIVIIVNCGAICIIYYDTKTMSHFTDKSYPWRSWRTELRRRGRQTMADISLPRLQTLYNSQCQSLIGCWSVDTWVGREMGRSDASSSPCGLVASQRICHDQRSRSLEVVGLQCSRKMLRNKIEFYNIIKLDLKIYF